MKAEALYPTDQSMIELRLRRLVVTSWVLVPSSLCPDMSPVSQGLCCTLGRASRCAVTEVAGWLACPVPHGAQGLRHCLMFSVRGAECLGATDLSAAVLSFHDLPP